MQGTIQSALDGIRRVETQLYSRNDESTGKKAVAYRKAIKKVERAIDALVAALDEVNAAEASN